jgi:fluoride exporter
MKLLIAIGTGSFIGGVLRYLLSQMVQSKFFSTFPFGTLSVNILGCLAIGIIMGFSERGNLTQNWRLFLATGLCGGFTTFSAFSNETLGMIRDGQNIYALAYVAASILLGVLATFTGFTIVKIF